MFLKTRMMPSSGGPRAARSSETPVVQSSWSASCRLCLKKSGGQIKSMDLPLMMGCQEVQHVPSHHALNRSRSLEGAIKEWRMLEAQQNNSGFGLFGAILCEGQCWDPHLLLFEHHLSHQEALISMSKFHLALMIRWDSDSTALRTSWSPTQRLTAWFFRKLSTSRDLAFSKRARCSGVNFTNWTSALPTFLAMKSEGFLTSCFLWRWESMERSKEIMKASSTQGSWRAVWTSIVWASKAASCWSCSTHFMSYSRFLGRLLSGASECGSPGECSSGRSLMGVPGS